MKRNLIAFIAASALMLAISSPFGQADASSKKEMAVIVNKANTVGSISKSELSGIYLGKRRMWATGELVQPCDLQEPGIEEEQTTMGVFVSRYLNKDLATLKNYWIKMIFSGKGEPPVVFKRAEEVIHFVSENPGAIGYVPSDHVSGAVRVVPVGD